MKERPILMNGAMVRATLAGTKTQTRRVIAPRPQEHWTLSSVGVLTDSAHRLNAQQVAVFRDHEFGYPFRCPYGQPGDRLWVRECFAVEHQVEQDQKPPFDDGRPVQRESGRGWRQAHYRATDPTPELVYESCCSAKCPDDGHVHWTPSIHMRRWASRITLEVTGVRVERLCDITEEDALVEGILADSFEFNEHRFFRDYRLTDAEASTQPALTCPRESFRSLWESINGAGSWAANPWVWAIEFRRIP